MIRLRRTRYSACGGPTDQPKFVLDVRLKVLCDKAAIRSQAESDWVRLAKTRVRFQPHAPARAPRAARLWRACGGPSPRTQISRPTLARPEKPGGRSAAARHQFFRLTID